MEKRVALILITIGIFLLLLSFYLDYYIEQHQLRSKLRSDWGGDKTQFEVCFLLEGDHTSETPCRKNA